FKKTHRLRGVEAPDQETLILNFRKPFRTALIQFAGARGAAWKESEEPGSYLGTGAYVLKEVSDKKIEGQLNPFWKGEPPSHSMVEVLFNGEDCLSAVAAGKSDVFYFADG